MWHNGAGNGRLVEVPGIYFIQARVARLEAVDETAICWAPGEARGERMKYS